MESLRVFHRPPIEAREFGLLAFLAWLGRPAVFHLAGRDRTRCRVLMGGLHGNEPSGFHAVHALLRDPPAFPTDVVLILGNVPAALDEPGFYRRFLPDEEDMNRVWDDRPPTTEQRRATRAIVDYLRPLPIESIVDLHNNSGFNPIYAVVLDPNPTRVALARHWTRRYVHYEGLAMATFLEVFNDQVPGVVVECGQSGDPEADRRALLGARSYLTAERPWLSNLPGEDFVYRSVARVLVPDDLDLTFAAEHAERSDITISPRIDRHNFEIIMAGTLLAWRSERGRLLVIDNRGRDVTDAYLVHNPGKIHLRRRIVPVMMTTNAEAAKSDCLLYMAERVSHASTMGPVL